MCPRASAVALEASTVAYAGLLVGTLLVGAGVAFSNPGDMLRPEMRCTGHCKRVMRR